MSALAVPDDCSCLYASSQDEEEEGCYWLFRIPMTEDGEEDEEPEICADKETSLSEDLRWQGNKPI